MKIRNDYVSNSSSCSFFVYIADETDVKEFNVFKEKTERMFNVKWSAFESPDAINAINYTTVCPGFWMYCYLGDDDELDNIYDLQDIKNTLENSPYKFKVFKNKHAHYSIGAEINE